MVKNLPAMWETLVQTLGWEALLEKGTGSPLQDSWASPVAQTIKNPPAMQEIWVGKIWRRAWQPTPVFLPGESQWTEEPGGLQSMRSQELDTTERLSTARVQEGARVWAYRSPSLCVRLSCTGPTSCACSSLLWLHPWWEWGYSG